MLITLKYLSLVIGKILLLPTVPFAAILVSLFTKEMPTDRGVYRWGSLWGTYDNPPQGDRGYVAKRSFFPNVTTGFKGYLNRVVWMIRNPLYGYNKLSMIKYNPKHTLTIEGNPNISDKYKISGKMFAKLTYKKKLKGFEFYCVLPYSKTRNFRCRLGWKLKSSKFQETGFAPLVFTINPFDGYGNKESN